MSIMLIAAIVSMEALVVPGGVSAAAQPAADESRTIEASSAGEATGPATLRISAWCRACGGRRFASSVLALLRFALVATTR